MTPQSTRARPLRADLRRTVRVYFDLRQIYSPFRPKAGCAALALRFSSLLVAVTTPTSDGVTKYSSFTGFAHLAAGLACGLSGLAAGIAIGIVGDAGVRANAQQAKLYVGMVLILIFAEALGLYGLIVGLILTSKTHTCGGA